jgi:hypothetical protein
MKKWNLSMSDLGSWGVDALTVVPLKHVCYGYGEREFRSFQIPFG